MSRIESLHARLDSVEQQLANCTYDKARLEEIICILVNKLGGVVGISADDTGSACHHARPFLHKTTPSGFYLITRDGLS